MLTPEMLVSDFQIERPIFIERTRSIIALKHFVSVIVKVAKCMDISCHKIIGILYSNIMLHSLVNYKYNFQIRKCN